MRAVLLLGAVGAALLGQERYCIRESHYSRGERERSIREERAMSGEWLF